MPFGLPHGKLIQKVPEGTQKQLSRSKIMTKLQAGSSFSLTHTQPTEFLWHHQRIQMHLCCPVSQPTDTLTGHTCQTQLQVTFKPDALFSEDPDKKAIILSVKLNSSEISSWLNQFKHCFRGCINVLEVPQLLKAVWDQVKIKISQWQGRKKLFPALRAQVTWAMAKNSLSFQELQSVLRLPSPAPLQHSSKL